MALLMFDGFETYRAGAAGAGDMVTSGRWKSSGDVGVTTIGRTGVGGISTGSFTGGAVTPDFTTTDTLIGGFGYRGSSLSRDGYLLEFRNTDGARMASLYMVASQDIEVRGPGDAVLFTFTPGPQNDSTWQYYELKVTFHATAGAIELRMNGVTRYSATDLDTSVAGNTTFQEAELGSIRSSRYFDDFYLCDSSGTENNDFLGPVRIHALSPASDAAVAWTPNSGTTNYTQVDDMSAGHDSDTSYAASSTVGAKDLYGLTDLAAEYQNPVAVQMYWAARHDDSSGGAGMASVLKSGVTEVEGAEIALASSYTVHAEPMHVTNPDTGLAWTPAEINALQIGAVVKSNL